MFVRNCWYVAAWSAEVTAGELFARRLLGESVVFYRSDDGEVAALENRCCHRFAPLASGRREGDRLRCMYHGLVFDRSGRCVEVPGETKISPQLRVRSYPVIERDEFVWIWMGDPERAGVAGVLDAHWQSDPAWVVNLGGYIHFAANYELIADNLLDLSHAAYLHSSTIGAATIAQRRPVSERGDNAMHTTHALPGELRPPFAAALTKLPETIDRTLNNTWFVKGNFFSQSSVMAPAGAGEDSTDPATVRLHTTIALTPESDRSTHYFWSTAHNRFTTDAPNVTTLLSGSVARAFEEDRTVIEAQQRIIDERGPGGMVPLGVDRPFMQVRQMVRRLVDEENGKAVRAESPVAAL